MSKKPIPPAPLPLVAAPPIEADDGIDERDQPDADASFTIVGVGASAGGLEAFTQLLEALPTDTGMAFVLVQHLAASHPSALAEILSRATKMPVLEVRDASTVEPNHVYIIPPDRSMVIRADALQLLPRQSGVHRPIDEFFRSLAQERLHQAIGVVLSGTATDGTLGLQAIKAEGGITFAQDATAQHESMPRSAIASGCVDFVLPPHEIAHELVRIGQHLYAGAWEQARESGRRFDLGPLIQLLHHATGVDFTGYKFNTLYRRVTRRMVFQKMKTLPEYVQYLRQTPAEVEAMYQDILIGVTRFFRDQESFEALKSQVFARLLKDRSRHEPMRLWTLGCSTGEEAYSLAIAFTEAAEAAGSSTSLQLFASDLNAAGIAQARAGVYPMDIAQDVSPQRLRRFFTEVDGQYRIVKTIRDACVFSRHNVLADPPFSRIDLISCRNLLIYMQPVLQQRIMPTLHYALKPAGCLWLGGSETIGAYGDLFEVQDVKHKIYVKKPRPGSGHGHFPLRHDGLPRPTFTPISARPSEAADLHREADRLLSVKFAPPGVLVSADLDILQYRGDTSPYLAPAPGKASLNLLKMLREGLLVGVRAAVLRASNQQAAVREEGLRVKSDGAVREIAIEVIPIKADAGQAGGFLVLFDEPPAASQARPAAPGAAEVAGKEALSTPDPDNARLTRELAATREFVQSVIDQQEAANEELQSANEEVQSANEELQSSNEELETSKEEIQSSNEELVRVNDELINRNAELDRVNNDLANLLGSVQMPIVMVGVDLRVRRFTPAAEKMFNLIATDVGRPLADIQLNLDQIPNLGPLMAEVLDTVSVREREVRDKHGHWYLLRLRPYRTLDNRIDGVVVMLVDVDAMKRIHAYTESIVATVREPLVVLDPDLRVRTASRAFYEHFLTSPKNTERRLLYELDHGQWDSPHLRQLLEEILPRDNQVDGFRLEHAFARIGTRTLLLNARRLIQAANQAPLILLGIEDITQRDQLERQLLESEQRFRDLADNIPQLAWIADANSYGQVSWFNQNWFAYTGTTLEQMKGAGWQAVHHPDHVDAVAEKFGRHVQQGLDWEDTFPLRAKNGQYRWFLSRMKVIRDDSGAVVRIFGTNTDVTEQREMADALRRNATDMAAADVRKNQFLAMLAHELRNPLAPIRNAMQILRLSDSGGQATVRSAAGMVDKQVDQMVRLVDDLLDVSRITHDKIALREELVDLTSLINDAVEVARPVCASRKLALTVTLPAQPIALNVDPTRLLQVLGNLIGNACKFTDAGGRIYLSAASEGSWAVIRVRDDGIGIAAEQLDGIFDLFVQVDVSLGRSTSGLGIGLTVAKRLVEMHGGTLQVLSPGVGLGSEFVVRLPIVDAALQPALAKVEVDAPATKTALRVLVVDDNRDAATSLAMLLTLSGNETRTAYDGLAALQVAAAFAPDLVLLDIGLPKLNGFEVARKIREQPWGQKIMLVALTGWGRDEDREKSKEAGFDHHLVKPVDAAAFEQLLAGLEAGRNANGG